MGIYLPGAGTLVSAVWPWAGIACSQGIPTDFYPPQMNVGMPNLLPLPLYATPCLCTSPPVSTSLLLLPIWMNVASLNPWLLVFHTA